MTNDYGEYLDYQIRHARNSQERAYYESLRRNNVDADGQYADSYDSTNNRAYVPVNGSIAQYNVNDGYKDIQPTTVDNDPDLQEALQGEGGENPEGNRDLDINSTGWAGMESGAIKYDSTQSPNWLETVPEEFRSKAAQWSANQGILEIIPKQQRQKFTYSTVAYIAKNTQEPKTQRIPISDVSVVPHQINFDFYDTTEGRVGVSNAVEKHMSVEFDVYLTDYIFYNWNSGGDDENKYYMDVPERIRKAFWENIHSKTYSNRNLMLDYEQTKEFSDFRMSFLQQHLGWLCIFNTHAFPTFQGVINDVSFSINSGESSAKWHVKLEEAIFTEAYSTTGQKQQEQSETSDGSETNSGDAGDVENV